MAVDVKNADCEKIICFGREEAIWVEVGDDDLETQTFGGGSEKALHLSAADNPERGRTFARIVYIFKHGLFNHELLATIFLKVRLGGNVCCLDCAEALLACCRLCISRAPKCAIGDWEMTRFIAEVSSNHAQSLDRSLEIVRAAARVGCDAVKFQLFRLEELFSPEARFEKPELENRKNWELPLAFIPIIAAEARSLGLEFGCTPFYLDAVAELREHVDFFKIASYELLWTALLHSVASTGLPLVLSTGMASLAEVKQAVKTAEDAGATHIEVLHCVSVYPCDPEDTNLAAIDTLRRETGLEAGWSDHSRNKSVMNRAIHRWGASSVEFHFDLDGTGPEFGPGHCWLPHEIEEIISESRLGDLLDGSGVKEPTKSEMFERGWRADSEDGLRPVRDIRENLGS